MICNRRCILHTISNTFAKYEHPLSTNKRGVRVISYETDYYVYLILTFDQGHIGDQKSML